MSETIYNGDYERYPEFFPVGAKVRCESEWQPGKWRQGTVSHHSWSSGTPRWIFIEIDDGSLAEYDYRWLDVEDPRNSLVRLVKSC